MRENPYNVTHIPFDVISISEKWRIYELLSCEYRQDYTDEEKSLWSEGYHLSMSDCPTCKNPLFMKSKTRPFAWESDIQVTTFSYRCTHCHTGWIEYDSQ